MTLILVAARTFGTVTNAWEASQHVNTQAEGFYLYQLGKAQINFARTDVGFILAALTCASAAIVVTPVRVMQRLIALTCLLTCVFLLLSTGSFGSIAACLCGLTAIFIAQFRSINIVRFIMSLLTIIFMLVLVYLMLPAKTKAYLDKRYEHRIEKKDTDRLILWGRAFDSFVAHPGGVGYTLQAGEEGTVKTWTHNEYLTYFVSYGAAGGLAYAAFVIWLCGSFFLIRKQVSDDPAALAVYLAGLAVLVAASVNSMTDTMSGNRMNYNVIWSMIWYCYFCSQAGQSVIASETREAISVR
jgi:O-antigen ligase